MITIFDKGQIIKLKENGLSNRKVAFEVGINRKTVAKIWNKHLSLTESLTTNLEINKLREIQEQIIAKPSYNSSNRKPRKFNDEMEALIDDILEKESIKDTKLGLNHKQKITNSLIHQILLDKGYDISLTTITNVVRRKKSKLKETFIKQSYQLGQRLEFDFGEVKLMINGIFQKYYLAVLSSPASNYRMAYLYKSQCKKVFQDAHVRFFESVKGIYNEVVYDNMRNVVSKFIGRNEKVINDDLVKMAMYYGFDINVTNCFSGNEKGHVEGSVKHIRKQAFSLKYEFKSFEKAQEHLENILVKINLNSKIDDEIKCLKAYKPKLEIADICKAKVSKYSVVRVDNNYYSVPEDLNGKEVIIKNYVSDINIYYNHELICKHQKIDGYLEYVLDINHYIKTFKTKPGSLRNSQALANNTKLKTIYSNYYTKKEKLFIELIEENKHLGVDKLNEILLNSYNHVVKSKDIENKIIDESRKQISIYNKILKGEVSWN